jgi:uncharacterized RmlC-like cupin family protein
MRPDDAPVAPGPPTSGMDRRELFSGAGAWAGWVRTEAGVAGGWHHHGDHDSYIFVTSGEIAIDYGAGGHDRVVARAGSFIFNPAGMVHRETTGPDGPAEAFVVRVGSGPLNINVDGPDPDGSP